MDKINTICVVDDDPHWRSTIQQTLEIAGYSVELYDSAEHFLQNYQFDGGCIVLDLELSGMSGLELQETLLDQNIQPSIIFISSEANVAASVQAMRAGAIDFLQKPFKDVELLARVQEAIDQNMNLRHQHEVVSHLNDRIDTLTRREKEVLDLVLEGFTNKEIATQLGLSHRTVELHRSRVMAKMKAQSIVELVKMTNVFQA